ncbi:hypothetical protein LTR85_001446 [Meristemomyces frigidus]|nr:hypothetical protein LTR85_001446 [Meristemomyces frigidus]
MDSGISFFSEYRGWSCDDVISFKIVLANSTIVEASYESHAGLYRALRGGGGNFGIVTEITMATFNKAPSHYTFKQWEWSARGFVFAALALDAAAMPEGVTMIATTIAWHPSSARFVISERYVADAGVRETSSTGSTPKPEQRFGYYKSTLDMAEKMDRMNPIGFYNLFGSITVRNDAAAFVDVADIFQEIMYSATAAEDIQMYTVFNPLTVPAIKAMQKRGGNVLGLKPQDGPLMVVNLNMRWSNPADTSFLRLLFKDLLARAKQASATRNALHPLLFLNHAYEEEDVFAGYGEQSLQWLRQVRHAVDPDGIFQRLVPGYFKLGMELGSAGDTTGVTRQKDEVARRSEL